MKISAQTRNQKKKIFLIFQIPEKSRNPYSFQLFLQKIPKEVTFRGIPMGIISANLLAKVLLLLLILLAF